MNVFPPRPGWVYTRIVATFSIIPSDADSVSLRVSAVDASGNPTELYQVEARGPGSGAICGK